jgi:D-alanyl-D-alanine carboxypeptidase/D-alanyl-D-alanine carboxypeptidase (penicillin-binding protein 5/6)
LALLAFSPWAALPVKADQGLPGLSALSAVLMLAETGEVLYSKAGKSKLPMASTTKLMTALIACEADTPGKTIRMSEELCTVEGSGMGLKAGDEISLRGLVLGAMLASGNDAANAIAVMLGGTQERFAAMMNRRAKELGMVNTLFVTPSGLDAPGHCSTAYDMALLARAALENPILLQICASKSAVVRLSGREIRLSNHNRLLREYEGCLGLKTGFTKKAGRCLVSAARRGGLTLVCVTLNAPSDWTDHKRLLDYGFALLDERAEEIPKLSLNVVGGREASVELECPQKPPLGAGAASCVALVRPFEYAPIAKGILCGELRYYSKAGKLIISLPLVTSKEVRGKDK